MPLSHEELQDIRALHAAGHHVGAIAESYGVTKRYIYDLVSDPPTAEELEAVADARQQLVAGHDEGVAHFAGFSAEAAGFAAEVFGLPADGGDAFDGPDGGPRSGLSARPRTPDQRIAHAGQSEAARRPQGGPRA